MKFKRILVLFLCASMVLANQQSSIWGAENSEENEADNVIVGGYLHFDIEETVPAVQDEAAAMEFFESKIEEGDNDISMLQELSMDKALVELPSDTLEAKYVPSTLYPVRNQNPFGTCWAFASVSLVEMSLAKKSLAVGGQKENLAIGDLPDLSEFQLAYFTYHDILDPITKTTQDKIIFTTMEPTRKESGSYRDNNNFANFGGNLAISKEALLAWKGQTSESQMPYNESDIVATVQRDYEVFTGTETTYAYPDSDAYVNNVAHVQNVYEVNYIENPDIAKKLIKLYGGMGISYYAEGPGSSYYDATNKSYYCKDEKQTNHAVTIVGWDDDYPASNFSNAPSGNGAWLVRNSWTETTSKLSTNSAAYSVYQYFWLSYEDQSIRKSPGGYFFDAVYKDSPYYYDNNYQYDSAGYTDACILYKNWSAANIFTCAEDVEEVCAVGVDFRRTNTKYKVTVYKLNDNYTSPVDGTAMATLTGTAPLVGFYTLDLSADKRFTIRKGQAFSVVVTSLDDEMIGVGIEHDISLIDSNRVPIVQFDVSASAGQSFTSGSTGKYTSVTTGNYETGNLRIKAYTNTVATEMTSLAITENGTVKSVISLAKTATTTLGVKAEPQTDYEGLRASEVSWTSDNEAIAKVNAQGQVTAISSGTTKIHAVYLYTDTGGAAKTKEAEITLAVQMTAQADAKTDGSVLVSWDGDVTSHHYELYGVDKSGNELLFSGTAKNYTIPKETVAEKKIKQVYVLAKDAGGNQINKTAANEWVTYLLSYDLAGGSLSGANPASYTAEKAVTINKLPTRSGYTFEGWTGTDLTNAEKTITIAAGQTGNRNYTANWKKVEEKKDDTGAGESSGNSAEASESGTENGKSSETKLTQCTSEVVTVNQESQTISKITAGTSVAEVREILNEKDSVTVTAADGSREISGEERIGTGMIIHLYSDGKETASYTVIVTGDTSGDGQINGTDMMKVKSIVLNKGSLEGAYFAAGDVNGDGKINATDFMKIKATILKKDSVTPR